LSVKDYELVQVSLSELTYDPENPNEMTEEEEESLRKSFKKFGNVYPILIDQNKFIVHGNHRAKVLQEMGLDQIKVIQRDFADDNERRLCSQTMNKLHGQYETIKDSNQLLLLFQNSKLEELSQLIAQPKEDLQRIIQKGHPEIQFQYDDEFDVDKALEEIVPTTQLGDLWELGRHRLICADCTDQRSLAKLIGNKKIHQLNTDPPYGVNYSEKAKVLNKNEFTRKGRHQIGRMNERPIVGDESEEHTKDFHEYFTIIFNLLKGFFADYNTIYIWSGDWHLHEIRQAAEECDIKFSNYNIWIKNAPSFSMGRKDYEPQHEYCMYGWFGHHNFYGPYRTTLFEYNRAMRNELHPTMKPVPLIAQTIQDGSQEGDNILDIHMGSGTCLIACEQTNRKCFGVEIDPHYVDITIKRWEDFTGQKANLLTKHQD
jgi:DNA modification methylase